MTDRIGRVAGRVGNEAYYLGWCMRSGMLGVASPLRVAQGAKAFLDYGMLGGVSMVPTTLHPKRTAIIDDRGEITYRELNDRINAIATAWLATGLKAGDGVAMLIRNHRGFFEAVFAAARCGARVILMNTGFSGPQVREVAAREGVDMMVYDEEFEPVVKGLELRFGGYRAWLDSRFHDPDTLDHLVATTEPKAPPKPAHPPRLVILTSGTTGAPKGAGRDVPVSLSPVGGPAQQGPVPLRRRLDGLGAALPRARPQPGGHADGAVRHPGAATAVHSRRRTRHARCPWRQQLGGRAGDAPARARAGPGALGEPRHLVAAG